MVMDTRYEQNPRWGNDKKSQKKLWLEEWKHKRDLVLEQEWRRKLRKRKIFILGSRSQKKGKISLYRS